VLRNLRPAVDIVGLELNSGQHAEARERSSDSDAYCVCARLAIGANSCRSFWPNSNPSAATPAECLP
jgi:hypothetical protein